MIRSAESVIEIVRHIKENGATGILYEIFFIILNIIIIIFTFFYNEVIIIKLFSMEKFTAKYISLRQRTEYESLDKFYNDNEDDISNNSESITSIIECRKVDNEK